MQRALTGYPGHYTLIFPASLPINRELPLTGGTDKVWPTRATQVSPYPGQTPGQFHGSWDWASPLIHIDSSWTLNGKEPKQIPCIGVVGPANRHPGCYFHYRHLRKKNAFFSTVFAKMFHYTEQLLSGSRRKQLYYKYFNQHHFHGYLKITWTSICMNWR